MALSRKQALKLLRGWATQVELHLAKLASDPGARSLNHHQHEIRIWLRDMEEVLPYVGKKTAAAWQGRIDAYRHALEGRMGEA